MEYKINNRPELLKHGDTVIFKVKGVEYKHEVKNSYLRYRFDNRFIFQLLNINECDFCKKHYGYDPTADCWPECKPNDFEALTRVVNALYDEITKQILPKSLFTL
jgi:hypothetical protein